MFAAGLSIHINQALSLCANPREPVVAGTFFPKDRTGLETMISTFEQKADIARGLKLKKLKAIILPHAGYIYSGPAAGYGVRLMKGRTYDRVIVLALDHRVGFHGAAVTDSDCYQTPLGTVGIHPASNRLFELSDIMIRSRASDRKEHSLEVLLPYLQYALGDFQIIPIKTGFVDPEAVVTVVDKILEPDDLIVASSDLSHFLSYDQAVKTDTATIKMIIDLDHERFLQKKNAACGKIPVYVLMRLARERGWTPCLLNYINSGDTAGSKDRVVGYCTIAFFEDSPMDEKKHTKKTVTEDQGGTLVRLARLTIAEKLGIDVDDQTRKDIENRLTHPLFNEKRGTFVTLHINSILRGCIGNLDPVETITESIRDNSLKAAFSDPRFPPLEKKEFNTIDIEVSLLTKPVKLDYLDAGDLIEKLRPGIDGVILKKNFRSATFLPQVWNQLRQPEEFLSYLSKKAGLSKNEWKKGLLDIYTYEVVYFEEHR